ncbi:MAG: hypothetical protein ACRBFS_01245 [Aureispira sp.]
MHRPTAAVQSLYCSFLLLFLIGSLSSCKSTQEGSTSKNKTKNDQEVLLIYNDKVRDKSSYENIKGSVPRLQAMIAGRFTQYNTAGDPNGKIYSVWHVNEGKDSVVIYHIPVGDPNKDGYWMYHYQGLTSLPDEPVFTCFTKLEAVNRDSIIGHYYAVPEDFSVTIPELLSTPKELFKDFDFKNLKAMEDKVYYVRQNPLKYIGTSPLRPQGKAEDDKKYACEYYVITPERYTFSVAFYNDKKEMVDRSQEELLFKEAMVALQYIGQ